MNSRNNQPLTEEEHQLVRSLAARISKLYFNNSPNAPYNREDLEHAGIVGLLEARRAFKPALGVPFLGFAVKRVYGAMMDLVRRTVSTVAVPQLKWDRVQELKAAREALCQAGATPTPQLVAQKLGWSLSEVADVLRMIPRLESIHPDEQDDDQPSPGPQLTGGTSPVVESNRQQHKELLRQCLDAMESTTLRSVALARVLQGTKLRELAKLLGCTTQRVSQIEQQAMAQLRHCLESRGLSREDAF